MTGKEIGLSQMFPYPGKRDRAVQMAAREKEQAEFELAEARNMLRADVKMAYAELSTVRAQAELVRRTRALLEQVVDVSREMFAVGKGRQPDVLRGQIEFQKMREMLLTLENRERVLSIRLNTLAALPPGEPVPALDNLVGASASLDARALREIYLAERPARQAVQARIGKGEIGIHQAESGRRPDFEVSASYMQRDAMPDGTSRPDLVSAMVSMTLPVWGKGKIDPGIRAMTAEREMAIRDLETLDIEAANAIEGGLSSLENFAAVAKLYRTTLIPQAEQAVQANLEAYRVGTIDFPMLMDSLMSELGFRQGIRRHGGGDAHGEGAARGRGGEGARRERRRIPAREGRSEGTDGEDEKRSGSFMPFVAAGAGPGRRRSAAFYTVPAFHVLLHPHAAGDNAAATPGPTSTPAACTPSSSPTSRAIAPSAG